MISRYLPSRKWLFHRQVCVFHCISTDFYRFLNVFYHTAPWNPSSISCCSPTVVSAPSAATKSWPSMPGAPSGSMANLSDKAGGGPWIQSGSKQHEATKSSHIEKACEMMMLSYGSRWLMMVWYFREKKVSGIWYHSAAKSKTTRVGCRWVWAAVCRKGCNQAAPTSLSLGRGWGFWPTQWNQWGSCSSPWGCPNTLDCCKTPASTHRRRPRCWFLPRHPRWKKWCSSQGQNRKRRLVGSKRECTKIECYKDGVVPKFVKSIHTKMSLLKTHQTFDPLKCIYTLCLTKKKTISWLAAARILLVGLSLKYCAMLSSAATDPALS